jgi:co-chaperonin GroES (HSP10)
MQERMMKTKDIAYLKADFSGKNTSSFKPVGDLVCIMCDEVDNMMGKGLISMTQEKASVHSAAVTSGIIVALGHDAFLWSADRKRPFGADKPRVGDHVVFVQYAGEEKPGRDGKTYRLMSDNSIVAVIDNSEAVYSGR